MFQVLQVGLGESQAPFEFMFFRFKVCLAFEKINKDCFAHTMHHQGSSIESQHVQMEFSSYGPRFESAGCWHLRQVY